LIYEQYNSIFSLNYKQRIERYKLDREELLKFIKGNPEPRELKRALAVKLVIENYSYSQIQQILNVSRGFISKWNSSFRSEGVANLKLGYKGAISYLNSDQKQEVVSWLKTKNYWDLSELEFYVDANYGVNFKSPQSYYNLFALAGISWKKSQKRNPRKEPKLVEQKKKKLLTSSKSGKPKQRLEP